MALGATLLQRIAETGMAATDLKSAGVAESSRNSVAAGLVSACLRGLLAFEREGLKPSSRSGGRQMRCVGGRWM